MCTPGGEKRLLRWVSCYPSFHFSHTVDGSYTVDFDLTLAGRTSRLPKKKHMGGNFGRKAEDARGRVYPINEKSLLGGLYVACPHERHPELDEFCFAGTPPLP